MGALVAGALVVEEQAAKIAAKAAAVGRELRRKVMAF